MVEPAMYRSIELLEKYAEEINCPELLDTKATLDKGYLEFEDALAENSIALLDFVYPGDLSPELPEETDFESDLEAIRAILTGLKADCEETYWSGVINLVDDFWTTVNKYIYLAKITTHQAKLS